jgi:3-hydroxyacyl-CoA dehydrogenase
MTSRRTGKVRDTSRNAAAFAGAEKLLARVPPEVIAPRRIAESVRTGLVESFEAGLRAEQTAFADCMDTRAARNRIYLFFATREMSKAPSLAGLEATAIAKAAVIGMGTMGTGIVQVLATAGVPVVVRDEEEAALQKGTARIRSSLEKRVGQGQRTPEWLAACSGRITTTTNWQDVADSALVIESVFEDVAVKRSVIARLEALCAPSTIIASNTSTISLDELGAGMRHGERLLGMHFFNPAQHMPLVEIIRREATAGSVAATALKFAKTIRKTPVLVRNREGFLVNRLFVPYLKEAFWLLHEGAAPAAIDGAMVEFGFAMGPLSLIDMAGLDILVCSDRVLRRAFPRHSVLPAVAERLVEQVQLGHKSGAGVYRYEKGDYAPRPSDTTAGILDSVRREQGLAPRKIEKDEITERLVLRMVSEAFYVLEESIVQRPSDLDVATVLGIGFPDFRGGVLQYARDSGMERVMSKLDKLVAQCGERFSVPAAARSLAVWPVDKGAG